MLPSSGVHRGVVPVDRNYNLTNWTNKYNSILTCSLITCTRRNEQNTLTSRIQINSRHNFYGHPTATIRYPLSSKNWRTRDFFRTTLPRRNQPSSVHPSVALRRLLYRPSILQMVRSSEFGLQTFSAAPLPSQTLTNPHLAPHSAATAAVRGSRVLIRHLSAVNGEIARNRRDCSVATLERELSLTTESESKRRVLDEAD